MTVVTKLLPLFLLLVVTTCLADAESARTALQAYLAKVPGAKAGQVLPVTAGVEPLTSAGYQIFIVRFRGYPIKAPPPFKNNNLFAVSPDGTIQQLADEGTLKQFFKSALPAVTTEDEAKGVFKIWLRLSEELHQDGYCTFDIVGDSVRVQTDEGTRTVSGEARATKGAKGSITAAATFDRSGKVTEAWAKADLELTGERPAGR